MSLAAAHPTATGSTVPAADPGVLAAGLLASIRERRAAADAAEVELLVLACAWADAHPDLSGAPDPGGLVGEHAYAAVPSVDEHDVEDRRWHRIPAVAWDAPAGFAAANRMTTTAGKALLRDALVLRHRLPRCWARLMTALEHHELVLSGERSRPVVIPPAWRARRIAAAVAGQPEDVVADVDARVAPVLATVGAVTLDRLVEEALLRLHPEDAELAHAEALDARRVVLDERTVGSPGVGEMSIVADAKDLTDLHRTLTDIAHVLGAQSSAAGDWVPTLDVRRSLAAGVLADPARAAALLAAAEGGVGPSRVRLPAPRKQTVLHLHLDAAALEDRSVVGREVAGSGAGRPVLAEQVRDWCGRTDTHLVVRPVIDTRETIGVDRYEIPDRVREHVLAVHPTCVFPYCAKTARSCDLDHVDPWRDPGTSAPPGPEGPRGGEPPGQTSTLNLAPLCRHHHRLKTHAGWRYRRAGSASYEWTDPHGQRFRRDPDGTTDLTPVGR